MCGIRNRIDSCKCLWMFHSDTLAPQLDRNPWIFDNGILWTKRPLPISIDHQIISQDPGWTGFSALRLSGNSYELERIDSDTLEFISKGEKERKLAPICYRYCCYYYRTHFSSEAFSAFSARRILNKTKLGMKWKWSGETGPKKDMERHRESGVGRPFSPERLEWIGTAALSA